MDIIIDEIIRSRRKTIALQVSHDARLIVRVPFSTSEKLIRKIIYEKRSWILKKQEEAKGKYKKVYSKEFVNGEGFLFLGNSYKLYVVDNVEFSLIFNNENFFLSRKFLNKAKEIFIKWYKKQAYKNFSERIAIYSKISGINYDKLKITNARKRWGSCSSNGNLNFTWRLIMAPLQVIDYVIVHELVHIKERNHSKNFWNKVRIILPYYETQKKWLKKNGHLLIL